MSSTAEEAIDEAWAKCNASLAELDKAWARDREMRRGAVTASCQATLRAVAEEEQAAAEARDHTYRGLVQEEKHCREAMSLLGRGEDRFHGWDLVGEDTGVEALPVLKDPQATPLFMQSHPHAHSKHTPQGSLMIVRSGAQLWTGDEEEGEEIGQGRRQAYPSILPEGARLVGTPVGLTQASGCAELDVLDMAQGGKCYVLVPGDSNFPPTTVVPYLHNPQANT